MGQLIKISLFVFLMAFSSCEELYLIDCAECYNDEPVEGKIEIKVYNGNPSDRYSINIYLLSLLLLCCFFLRLLHNRIDRSRQDCLD